MSTVSIFELFSGVERCRRPDEASAAFRSGRGLAGPYDLQLAGQALALDVVLVTGNTDEFSRVAGLKIKNWLE